MIKFFKLALMLNACVLLGADLHDVDPDLEIKKAKVFVPVKKAVEAAQRFKKAQKTINDRGVMDRLAKELNEKKIKDLTEEKNELQEKARKVLQRALKLENSKYLEKHYLNEYYARHLKSLRESIEKEDLFAMLLEIRNCKSDDKVTELEKEINHYRNIVDYGDYLPKIELLTEELAIQTHGIVDYKVGSGFVMTSPDLFENESKFKLFNSILDDLNMVTAFGEKDLGDVDISEALCRLAKVTRQDIEFIYTYDDTQEFSDMPDEVFEDEFDVQKIREAFTVAVTRGDSLPKLVMFKNNENIQSNIDKLLAVSKKEIDSLLRYLRTSKGQKAREENLLFEYFAVLNKVAPYVDFPEEEEIDLDEGVDPDSKSNLVAMVDMRRDKYKMWFKEWAKENRMLDAADPIGLQRKAVMPEINKILGEEIVEEEEDDIDLEVKSNRSEILSKRSRKSGKAFV